MILKNSSIKIPALLVSLAILGGCAPVQETAVRKGHFPRVPVEKKEHSHGEFDQEIVFSTERQTQRAGRVGPSVPAADLLSELLESAESGTTFSQGVEGRENIGKRGDGDSGVLYDFPMTMNHKVEFYLDFFQNQHRSHFSRWLSRSSRYMPMIEEIFSEAGLPLDLAYLAMIESGFNEAAYSTASAVGMWQFMKATGRHYDLNVNSYIDERRNPVKSTLAAATHLSELYQDFGSWYLAVAAYNAGQGKIRRAIKRYETTDFWELAKGEYLQPETKDYVPKLIAAIMIAREPEKYGFHDIEYEKPLSYDVVEVPRWTALKAVALAAGTSEETLRLLNRELRKPFTPPDNEAYELRIPEGKRDTALRNLPRVHAVVSTSFKTHEVRKGESIDSICKRYGIAKTVLLKANTLGTSSVRTGQVLRIPFQTTDYAFLPDGGVGKGYALAEKAGGGFVLHKIRPGETLSAIANKYNVPAHLIAAWNDLKDVGRIRAGKELALYVDGVQGYQVADNERSDRGDRSASAGVPVLKGAKKRAEVSYKVKPGDSLWQISRQHNVSMDELRSWNNLDGDILKPGSRLVLKVASQAKNNSSLVRETYYHVRPGDSLWTIAQRHNLSMENIKRWNNLRDNTIHPGSRLLLRVARDFSG